MRPVRIAAVCAAAVLTVVAPGVAAGAGKAPAAFALTGAYNAPALEGTDFDTVARVYASPTTPGTTSVQQPDDTLYVGPLSTGTSWFLHVNAKVGAFDDAVPPAGATLDPNFDASANLSERGATSANVRSDYMLESQNTIFDQTPQHAWLYLDDATSSADCARGSQTATADAARLWVRQPDRTLTEVPVPQGDQAYEVDQVPLRLPAYTIDQQSQPQYADITIRRVDSPADLVQTDQWHTGRASAAAGWRVDVDSYILTSGTRSAEQHAVLILGAATCSLH
ncbi:hypothetical protein [Amycolatopsis sp. GM8]|uniref:hypothetical protein n=1 Tax=Amycolatopsis sp. GM8 TaxID=2896530 RepID=UPI001F1C07EA|nr:hypothetical protein [Amycolatopsis sp. GM8]